jgi:hypothetical protein
MTWPLAVLCIWWGRTVAAIITVIIISSYNVIVRNWLRIMFVRNDSCLFFRSCSFFKLLLLFVWIIVYNKLFKEVVLCPSKWNKAISLVCIAAAPTRLGGVWLFTFTWKLISSADWTIYQVTLSSSRKYWRSRIGTRLAITLSHIAIETTVLFGLIGERIVLSW